MCDTMKTKRLVVVHKREKKEYEKGIKNLL